MMDCSQETAAEVDKEVMEMLQKAATPTPSAF